MLFRVLSFLIAAALLLKAGLALTGSRRFYARRRAQYSSETLPHTLLIPPVIVLTLALVSWFAAILHYQPWCWLVTGFLSVLSCMALLHLYHWTAHRQAMLKLISEPNVKRIDYILLALGLGFLALALFVY
jgi:hypothetical protein